MPPIFVAGALYALWRIAGTLTRHVWRPSGILDALANPDPKLPWDYQLRMKFAATALAVLDLSAYDITTRKGQVEMIADLAALGFKGGLIKLGVPILQRIIGAGSVRFLVQSGLNLPDLIDTFSSLLRGDTKSFLEDLVKGYAKLEELEDPATVGLKAAMEGFEFSQSMASFIQSPSPFAIPGLLMKGRDFVNALFAFVGAVAPFIPDAREDARWLQEQLPDAPDRAGMRWMSEEMPAILPTPGFDTLNPEVREVLSTLSKEILGPPIAGPPTPVGPGWRITPPVIPPIVGEFPTMARGPRRRGGILSLRRPTSSLAHQLKIGQGMTESVLEKMRWWLLGGGARRGGGWGDGNGGDGGDGGGGDGGNGGGGGGRPPKVT